MVKNRNDILQKTQTKRKRKKKKRFTQNQNILVPKHQPTELNCDQLVVKLPLSAPMVQ